jgi:hypothetical protein
VINQLTFLHLRTNVQELCHMQRQLLLAVNVPASPM